MLFHLFNCKIVMAISSIYHGWWLWAFVLRYVLYTLLVFIIIVPSTLWSMSVFVGLHHVLRQIESRCLFYQKFLYELYFRLHFWIVICYLFSVSTFIKFITQKRGKNDLGADTTSVLASNSIMHLSRISFCLWPWLLVMWSVAAKRGRLWSSMLHERLDRMLGGLT